MNRILKAVIGIPLIMIVGGILNNLTGIPILSFFIGIPVGVWIGVKE